MHSSYVKGPKIKAILEEENLECEEKLQKITSLLDGSDVSKEKTEGGLKLAEPTETGPAECWTGSWAARERRWL